MDKKKKSLDRRNFCKKMALLCGGAVLPTVARPQTGPIRADDRPGDRNIIRRTLGRTGISIPVLSLGSVSDGTLIRVARDAGVAHFDTAYRYAGGRNESLIGEALAGVPRDSYVSATKILGLRDNITGLIPAGVTPAAYKADFRKKVETSLNRLRVDRLDILYLHGVERSELLAEPQIQEVMLELQREGKTRFLGATFHHKELEMIPAAIKAKIFDVILTSYNFRQPHRLEVRQAIAAAAAAGLGIVAMKTVAGAYWDKERRHPINVPAALKWVLQDANVHTIIPSVENLDQLSQILALLSDLTLTPREEKDLSFGEASGLAGLYCDQCGACREACRRGLAIPTAMRAYMYAYGYGRSGQAKETLAEKEPAAFACRGCADCRVRCPMGFDVPDRLRDISRLLENGIRA